jgi:hypothetical protein
VSHSGHRIGYQSEKFLLRLRDIILHLRKLHNPRNRFAVTFFFTSDFSFVLAAEITLLNSQNFGLGKVGTPRLCGFAWMCAAIPSGRLQMRSRKSLGLDILGFN